MGGSRFLILFLLSLIIALWTNWRFYFVYDKQAAFCPWVYFARDDITYNRSSCQWPPSNTEVLRNPYTNLYDMALRPCVRNQILKSTRDPWSVRYQKLLRLLYHGEELNSSEQYNTYRMEDKLRINRFDYNYHLYPQLIDLEEIVQSVRRGDEVTQRPINDPSMPVLAAPKDICQPNHQGRPELDLIVFIKSCVRCRRDRDSARQTYMQPHLWSDFRIRFVFVTGLPPRNFTGQFDFDGVSISHRSHGNDACDSIPACRSLLIETAMFGDMLVGNFDDHYFSLTHKQTFIFRWISAFCAHESPLYLFLDHDYCMIPKNLIRFVRGLPREILPDVSGGIFGQPQKVLRPVEPRTRNRWSVSTSEIPWPVYPPYFPGQAYVIGIKVITDMAIAAAFLAPLRVEDAFMGFHRFRLHIPTYGLKHFTNSIVKRDELFFVTCTKCRLINRYIKWSTGNIEG